MGYSNIWNLFRSFLLEFSSRSFSLYHWLFQSPSQFLMTIFFLSFKHSWLLPILFRNTEELWYRTGEGNGTPLQHLAWKIPWMEEPGGLQSMGSLRVGHDWATSLSLFTFMHWRRRWQPIPMFLPGESQGRGSLVGFRLWGCRELDKTEAT